MVQFYKWDKKIVDGIYNEDVYYLEGMIANVKTHTSLAVLSYEHERHGRSCDRRIHHIQRSSKT